MEPIQSGDYPILFGDNATDAMLSYISKKGFSKVFILTDSNTEIHCLPIFRKHFKLGPPENAFCIPAGENYKNIDTCLQVWKQLSEQGADRQSLLINLGGGVVTDLGGFVASTYQRGISFINVPTTLLAMVDASVGGKTGVDLGPLKNQIGVINNPGLVLIQPGYLDTLDSRQLRSGFAEMLKHGLICDRAYWTSLKGLDSPEQAPAYIHESVDLKNQVVLEDPLEGGLRKILNFGHTLGHAIESYFLDTADREPLLHGEAIAAGMILEAFLSVEQSGLAPDECEEIKNVLFEFFPKVSFSYAERESIIELLRYDKKNTGGIVRFSLLETIGKACINQEVSAEQLDAAFDYYKD
ncbi:MAG: 3-dehydroquinate synthase [Robiginitalea sp.]|jgi:3-dehydroquinate synthase